MLYRGPKLLPGGLLVKAVDVVMIVAQVKPEVRL
jgi:hypothetical protein